MQYLCSLFFVHGYRTGAFVLDVSCSCAALSVCVGYVSIALECSVEGLPVWVCAGEGARGKGRAGRGSLHVSAKWEGDPDTEEDATEVGASSVHP